MYKKYAISEIGEIVSGATPKTSIATNFGGEIPWLTPADLSGYNEKYISHGARNLTRQGYNSCSAQLMPPGTVLLSSRAPIGYVAIAKNEICTNQGFKSIVPQKCVDSEFLYYQLKYLKRVLQDLGSGTTFKELSAKKLGTVQVVVPSIEEQRSIVAKIEELFSKLDASVAELQTAKEKLKVYRQAVLKEAFDTCDVYTKISNVCQHVTDGDHMPPPKADSGIPFIMISNIEKGNINWKNTKYVTENYYENIGEIRTPRKGDVLYTVTGSFGIPVMVNFDKKFCFQRHIALLRPNAKITQKYLFYVLQTPYVYTQASKKATGTAQKTVGLSVLRNITIPYCSIKEQIRIIEFLEQSLTICNSIEQTTDISLQQAEALRKSILKQAFDGKI